MGSKSKLTEKQEKYFKYLFSLAKENGYKEAKNKPMLYYKPLEDGVLFLDFRNLKLLSGRIELRPQIYSQDIPQYLENREAKKLRRKELLREDTAVGYCGYCEECGKDMGEDYFVVDEKISYSKAKLCEGCFNRRIKYIQNLKELPKPIENKIKKCPFCGKIAVYNFQGTYGDYRPRGFVKHHTSYEPEETILICRKCERRIHQEDGFHDELKPDMKREEWEEDRKYKLIPCANLDCNHKKQLPIKEYKENKEKYDSGDHLALCSKCENKKSIQRHDGEIVKVSISRGGYSRGRYDNSTPYCIRQGTI